MPINNYCVTIVLSSCCSRYKSKWSLFLIYNSNLWTISVSAKADHVVGVTCAQCPIITFKQCRTFPSVGLWLDFRCGNSYFDSGELVSVCYNTDIDSNYFDNKNWNITKKIVIMVRNYWCVFMYYGLHKTQVMVICIFSDLGTTNNLIIDC